MIDASTSRSAAVERGCVTATIAGTASAPATNASRRFDGATSPGGIGSESWRIDGCNVHVAQKTNASAYGTSVSEPGTWIDARVDEHVHDVAEEHHAHRGEDELVRDDPPALRD